MTLPGCYTPDCLLFQPIKQVPVGDLGPAGHPEEDGAVPCHVLLQRRVRPRPQLHQGRVTQDRTHSWRSELETTGLYYGQTAAKRVHGGKL